MADFLPQSDTEFLARAAQILDYIASHLVELHLTSTDINNALTVRSTFEGDLTSHNNAQSVARSQREIKDNSRDSLEDALRALIRRIQGDDRVADFHRLAMGITVRDSTRTSITAPSSAPILSISAIRRLQHEVAFRDEHSPTSLAKPQGVTGCEIWVKLGGEPPLDLTDCHFLATDTATPYLAKHTAPDVGTTAHYIGCWVNRKGERGPLSAAVSATIAG
jgi:hypothetical protein